MPAPPASEASSPMAEQVLGHVDALYHLARYLDAGAAEDLVQETYLRALQAEGRFAAGTNLRAWLFRILRNLFLSQVRQRRRHPGAELGEEEAETASSDDGWLRSDLELERLRRLVGAEIEAALRRLGADARTVVLLDLEGFSEAEVAQVMGCAVGTVKSTVSAALDSLRQTMRTQP
jgi:RNA polymerase sigma-70 factor (ECF subfamily)